MSLDCTLIIPLKENSSRLPGKNFFKFGNAQKPLWQIALDKAVKLREQGVVQHVAIYCKSELFHRLEIDEASLFAEETEPTEGRDAMVMFQNAAACATTPVIASLSCNSPFISVATLARCIRSVAFYEYYDSATLVRKVHTRQWTQDRTALYNLSECLPSQDAWNYIEADILWVRRREVIVKYGRNLGVNPHFIECSPTEAIDIDDTADLELARRVERGSSSEHLPSR